MNGDLYQGAPCSGALQARIDGTIIKKYMLGSLIEKIKSGRLASRLLERIARSTAAEIFLFAFLYTFVAALFVQLILIPKLIPSWNAGEGLLAGSDSPRFHQIAVRLSSEIRSHGWEQWELRPELQAPAGLAAAIYAITLPRPWVLLPLNAALHALSCVIVWKILLRVAKLRELIVYSLLPFIFFPSAAQWYSQIHKDGFTIAGALLSLLGWLLIWSADSLLQGLRGFALIAIGAFLAWLVRPYFVQILLAEGMFISILCLGFAFFLAVKRNFPRAASFLAKATLIFAVIISVFPFARSAYAPELVGNAPQWHPAWMPDVIDEIFRSVAATRASYLAIDGATNIDEGENFYSASDVLNYVPRAILISLLAPFPPTWFGEGSLAPNTLMRRVAGVEMVFSYLCFLGLIFCSRTLSKRPEFWITVCFCLLLILPQALVVANIGTLYRFRWGGFMVLVCLGFSELLRLLTKKSLRIVL